VGKELGIQQSTELIMGVAKETHFRSVHDVLMLKLAKADATVVTV